MRSFDLRALVVEDLRTITRRGLPVTVRTPLNGLVHLGVVTADCDAADPVSVAAAADLAVRRALASRGPRQRAARKLFDAAIGPTLTQRRRVAASELGYEYNHFRLRIEPVILEELADRLVAAEARRPRSSQATEGPTSVDTCLLLGDLYSLRALAIARRSNRRRFENLGGEPRLLWFVARVLHRHRALSDRPSLLGGLPSADLAELLEFAGYTSVLVQTQADELRTAVEGPAFDEFERFQALLMHGS